MKLEIKFDNEEELGFKLIELAEEYFKRFTRQGFDKVVKDELQKRISSLDEKIAGAITEYVSKEWNYHGLYNKVSKIIDEKVEDKIKKEIAEYVKNEIRAKLLNL